MINRLLSLLYRYWCFFALVLLTCVTLLSLWPLDDLPKVPGTDKTHHFIAYGAVMFPVALRKPRYWLLIAVLLVGYSGIIELLQPYVNRYAEWLDLAANAGGVACGAVLSTLVKSTLHKPH